MGWNDECQVRTSFKCLKYSAGGDALPSLVSEKNIGGSLGGNFKVIGDGNLDLFMDLTVDLTIAWDHPVALWNVQNPGMATYTNGDAIKAANENDNGANAIASTEFSDAIDKGKKSKKKKAKEEEPIAETIEENSDVSSEEDLVEEEVGEDIDEEDAFEL